MKTKYRADLQEAAKNFCLKTELPPDVIITSTKYSLAGLLSFHAGAEWMEKRLKAKPDTSLLDALKELVEAQGKYILFLTHHYNDSHGIATVHGLKTLQEDVEKGIQLRNDIEAARKAISSASGGGE